MKLDSNNDRKLLLAIFEGATFQGNILEHAADLKRRIALAPIEVVDKTPETDSPVKLIEE